MNSGNEENLKKLFEKFVEGEQAEQAVENIHKGEQILRDHTAPEPKGELIASIKTKIATSLLHKRQNAFRKTIYKTAAVAAGFIFLAVISVKVFEKEHSTSERFVSSSIMPKAVWESECLADDSEDSATLVAEVEQIESDLLALQVGENGGNGYEAVTGLEMELVEINSDFWKG